MSKILLKDLKHKIAITDHVDKPVGAAEIETSRIVLFTAYAKLEDRVNSFRVNSFRVNTEDRENATHIFIIRERHDYEIGTKNWVYRDYKGRRDWYKVLSTGDIEDCGNCYTRILASLWVRDSDRLDSETQDIPCEEIEPDKAMYDYRDAGW